MAKALLAFDADLLEAAGLHKERLRKLIQDAEAEPADPIRADLYFADASAPMPGGEHVHAR